MIEADVKRKMSEDMKDAGAYARRIEDTYAVGIFDMVLIPKGLPMFAAEVKMIHGNYFGPTPRQHIELVRIETVAANAGHVIPVMIGYKEGVYHFHKPQMRIAVTDCFTSRGNFHDALTKYHKYLEANK